MEKNLGTLFMINYVPKPKKKKKGKDFTSVYYSTDVI
jgi:hypothetical protein